MDKQISYRGILRFWVPLSLMWIVMALEMPVINSFVARMPHPKENLAVFGVVFSLALIIEGPIIQMLSAATAIATHYSNYRKLLNFMHAAAAVLTLLHLICSLPEIFNLIALNLLGIEYKLVPAARKAFLLMLPWTASIGYRRMWQGLMIQNGRTVAVTVSMILRMSVTCSAAAAGYYTGIVSGSSIAAISLTSGVIGGAVFAGIFARKTIAEMKKTVSDAKAISYRKLLIFYIPLAMTSFITMANRPVLTAGISRAQAPLESLAVWPVIISFMFLFQGFPLSFQETAISLMGNEKNIPKLKKFIFSVSLFTLFFYGAVIFSPVMTFILGNIIGLKKELINAAMIPLVILMALPFVSGLIVWLRAVNIKKGSTLNIASAVVINFITLILSVFVLNTFFKINGAVLAALCFSVSVSAEAVYLVLRTGRQNPPG